jgi:hypothetical protein
MRVLEELLKAVDTALENVEDDGCGCCSEGELFRARFDALNKARDLVEILIGEEGAK